MLGNVSIDGWEMELEMGVMKLGNKMPKSMDPETGTRAGEMASACCPYRVMKMSE